MSVLALSLSDLHKASGGDEKNKPAQWRVKGANLHIITLKGRNGGSFADEKTYPEDSTLYCLNDLHKASGLKGQLGDLVKNLTAKAVRRFSVVKNPAEIYENPVLSARHHFTP